MKPTIFSKNMKFLRAYKGFTQEQMAKEVKTNRGNIESYEQGRAVPRADFADRIANYFGLTIHQLFNQPLTEADLNITGRVESVTEIKLAEAYKRIELLETLINDKDKIIALYEKSVT